MKGWMDGWINRQVYCMVHGTVDRGKITDPSLRDRLGVHVKGTIMVWYGMHCIYMILMYVCIMYGTDSTIHNGTHVCIKALSYVCMDVG